jgi:Ricin-type beta-trefoil lectin domain-like
MLIVLIAASAGLPLFVVNDAVAQDKKREPYYRIQLKHGEQYLDADHCSATISLNPGSDFAGGACQLWRFVPVGDGWSRLQLKQGGQYLDADHCSAKISLNPGSDFAGGACQLWRLVPAG